jgi:hypothetical protein
MRRGESFGAFGHKVNMRTLAENLAGGADGVGNAFDAANASGAERVAVHDKGVELNFAVEVEEAAATSVERLVVFHDDDGFFDRVEGRSAAFEDAPSRSSSVTDAVEVSVRYVVGHGPSAAVDD